MTFQMPASCRSVWSVVYIISVIIFQWNIERRMLRRTVSAAYCCMLSASNA